MTSTRAPCLSSLVTTDDLVAVLDLRSGCFRFHSRPHPDSLKARAYLFGEVQEAMQVYIAVHRVLERLHLNPLSCRRPPYKIGFKSMRSPGFEPGLPAHLESSWRADVLECPLRGSRDPDWTTTAHRLSSLVRQRIKC